MTNLPQDWEVKKLGDIAEISSGGTPSRNKKEYWENGIIPWVKIKDIKEKFISTTEEFITEDGLKNSSAKLFKKGTLLYSIFATLGEVAILDIDATTNQAIAGINIKENNINSLYLMYFLKSIKDKICSKGRGVAQNNLNLTILKQIEIPLPPLKEQERIVGILDESFAKIDESIKILEQDLLNLDELMQSALQKAFNPLKDNAKENYQLPQGWEWKSLNSVVLKTSNINPCNFNEDKFYYIDISSIDNKNFCICNIKNIYKQDAPSRARKDVLYGDVLYATTRPNLKNIAINYYNFNNIVASTGFCILRANEKLNNKYLFFFLLSDIFDNYISKYIRGAQYPSVSDKDIFNSKIPLSPLQEQEQIASYLDELSSHVKDLKQNYQAQIKNLQELKKSLLDKAFKGKL
ncbi:restriction endonuclease subunit S [Campylobacter lari]|nr:restriction endonuclease subunit S [Campylobacter lari]